MKKIIWIILGLVVVVGLGALMQTVPSVSEVKTVKMIDVSGKEMGTVRLSKTNAGVLLDLKLAGLTPNGEHAMHIHEVGKCDFEQKFKTAGGHYNPHGKHHGMKHPEGQHAGDMPNLKPNKKGEIATAFVNMHVTLDDGEAGVFDADGSSLIIHAGADDHMSQPSGAAGDRIACGIIGR